MTNLLLAYLGGLLLNFLPCILPTLALKVTSKDRDWFVAGMLSVFGVLGGLAAALGFGWGQHLQSQPFIVSLAAVTFACGLAYLGVWHFPIGSYDDRTGAFGQGVLATLLGAGCSGPLLGPVFAATLTQHPAMTFAIFMSIGLGMVTPYLIPLPMPKPGAWMATLEKLAGFGMLATSLWLLSGVQAIFPTLILLLAIGFVCVFPRLWYVLILTLIPFNMGSNEWQPFNGVPDNGVALVQFSAPLCLTCDMNKAILDTMDLTVPKLYADVANNPAAAELLRKLGYDSVPVLAIFCDGEPVAVLPDLITAADVAAALNTLGDN